MINADMRLYDYFIYGEPDAYGQPVLSTESNGQVKMAINTLSQSLQQNILYTNAQYIGLTHENVTDKYVIQYGEQKLKVLYVNPKGRFTQVFMGAMA